MKSLTWSAGTGRELRQKHDRSGASIQIDRWPLGLIIAALYAFGSAVPLRRLEIDCIHAKVYQRFEQKITMFWFWTVSTHCLQCAATIFTGCLFDQHFECPKPGGPSRVGS